MSSAATFSSAYAPANFEDATKDRPLDALFDMTGTGLPNAYSLVVENVITKAVEEMRQAPAVTGPSGWKKRLRDFMTMKHQRLLDFLEISVTSNPTISRVDQLFQRFAVPAFHPSNNLVRGVTVDISGYEASQEILEELNQELAECTHEATPVAKYFEQTKHLFEKYRETGDAILALEASLAEKVQVFDRLQGKLGPLFDIAPNDKYGPLMESVESYLAKAFEENGFEQTYFELIRAYRRFLALRELVLMSRARDILEKEPLCSICLIESVSYAITPCGHTFCQTCSRRQNGHCYICRGGIKDKVRLFFG
jgi:hypothetical protein